MKIKQDLPSAPSDRYSRKFIEVCDKYREKYKKLVRETDFIYDPEISYIERDSPADDFSIPCFNNNRNLLSVARAKAYLSVVNNRREASRVLVKQVPYKTILGTFRFQLLSNEQEIITAIYVPYYINNIRLSLGFGTWGIVIPINIFEHRETERLLDEEKTIPVSKNLGGLLREARSHEQVPLDYQEEEKNIEGQIYKRIQLAHPWCSFMMYSGVFSEQCNVFVELIYMAPEKASQVFQSGYVGIVDNVNPYLVCYDSTAGYDTIIYDSDGNKLENEHYGDYTDNDPLIRGSPLPTDINLINDLSLLGDLKTEPYVIT